MGLFHALLTQPALFHYLRLPVYWGTLPRLAAALALRPGERLLDVGCGSGAFAALSPGPYVGVDVSLPYLRFCRSRLPASTHSFIAMSAFETAFTDAAFDKAIIVNTVHHLDAAAVDTLLRQLRRVVRTRVVLMDAAPEVANPVERYLLAHDRGDYVRERPALRALIAPHFDIVHEETFHNTLRIVPQVIFALAPHPAGATLDA